jgi:tetratricopeptide (TPR) repeat protein
MIPVTEVVASQEGLRRAAMSLRLPERLHKELKTRSDREGVPMNELVGRAVADMLGRPDLAPARAAEDISSQIARDAIRSGPEAIGPLKGIAWHCANLGQPPPAAVLYAAAARLVLAAPEQGPEAAAHELAHTAAVMEESNHYEIAVALWQEALGLDPNNLVAANRLGQRLHHLAQRAGDDVGQYREAERHLARVTFMDNHAKLFHGWSALFVARADRDSEAEHRARQEVIEALKHWAFGQRDGNSRRSWMRQLQRLVEAGLAADAEELRQFANRNAEWGPVESNELATA